MPLTLFRRPGQKNWIARGTVHGRDGVGRYVYKSTRTHRRAEAERIRVQWESELSKRGGTGSDQTFFEAAVNYLEAGGEARYLGRFDEDRDCWTLLLGHFMTTPLAAIDQAALDDAARVLYPGCVGDTINRQVFTPMLAVMNRAGIHVKVRRPRSKQRQAGWAEPEVFDAICRAAPDKLRPLLIFMAGTGRRVTEAVTREPRHVNLNLRMVDMGRTKNGETFTAYLPDDVAAVLANLPVYANGRLFGYLHRWSVYKPLKAACAAAGVPYLTPHELGRHTYATWMRRYGGSDLKELAMAGGWRSLDSVARYAHVRPAEAARAADKIPLPKASADSCEIRAVSPDEKKSA